MQLTVVGLAHGGETGPSLLVGQKKEGTLRPLYLFGCPDGISRVVLEHRIARPSIGRLAAVFSTRQAPEGLGGVASLLLRSSTDGGDNIHVRGPPGTVSYLHSLRHIVSWRYPRIFGGEILDGRPCFDDPCATVFPLLAGVHFQQPDTSGDNAGKEAASSAADHKRQKMHERRERPSAMTFPKSERVFMPDQPDIVGDVPETHRPALFVSDPSSSQHQQYIPASDAPPHVLRPDHSSCPRLLGYVAYFPNDLLLVVVDVPDETAASWIPSTGISSVISNHAGPVIVAHFSPRQVSQSPCYQQWRHTIADSVFHLELSRPADWKSISMCPSHASPACANPTVALKRLILHNAAPSMFPTCPCLQLCHKPADDINAHLSAQQTDNSIPGVLMSRLAVSPSSADDDDVVKSCIIRADFTSTVKSVAALASLWGKDALSQALLRQDQPTVSSRSTAKAVKDPACDAWQVVFFGTGSAEPSRHRGSSGILIQDSGPGAILLDAGDGCLTQMVQLYGEQRTWQLVSQLRVVWISHKHADHCLGLISLILFRHRGSTAGFESGLPPLIIIGPDAVGRWLREAFQGSIHPRTLANMFTFCHFSSLDGLLSRTNVFRGTGISSISSIPVQHCHDAHAAVVRFDAGLVVAYSGDARPSTAFSEAARDCDLLIHEATFDDRLSSHAEKKAHSTVGEAMGVSKACNAKRTILTHFSQRYPLAPPLPRDSDHADRAHFMIATDGMHVGPSTFDAYSNSFWKTLTSSERLKAI